MTTKTLKDQKLMIIIFGATGDLAKTKLLPALYWLYHDGVIHKCAPIVCVARKDMKTKDYVDIIDIEKNVPKADKKKLDEFKKMIIYQKVSFDKPDHQGLKKNISRIERKFNCTNNKVFYLATPPELFKRSVNIIRRAKLLPGKGWKRIVFEKPFGNDERTAKKLNKDIISTFKEDQIFRIDHYLGKELVKNIMVFRFANSVFEEVMNNKFVDHVQITLAEKKGVDARGHYYDSSGAIRDMVQNHMLQILSLIAMDAPKSISADDIRDQKVKTLKSLNKIKFEDFVIGQYTKGKIDGREVPSYLEEENTSKGSKTETYAALKVTINNKRWQGVPFYLRTGKRMSKYTSEINIVLKDVACKLFSTKEYYHGPNIITMRIQPDQGIAIRFNALKPGHGISLHPAIMDFCHHCLFGLNTPKAYEVLFYEIVKGDRTLFTRWDGIEASWRFIDPIYCMIKKRKKKLSSYKAGTYGPREADMLLKRDKRRWFVSKDIQL